MTEQIHFRDGESIEGPGKYDAGHDVSYTPYYLDPECTTLGGLMMWHPCTAPHSIPWNKPGRGPNTRTGSAWGYIDEHDPERITLVGSVLDPECGWHGFVQSGKWVPC